MDQESNTHFLVDALYCREERWEEEKEEEEMEASVNLLFMEQEQVCWNQDELLSLLNKEKQTHKIAYVDADCFMSRIRREAVEWMLMVAAHYSFSSLTTILSVDYFDRFLSSSHFRRDKPWMAQLVAVSCLSLAAKVEETQVPLLLDLQVEQCKYVFEAKTVQRMELLVLSTLDWKMNCATTFSFIEYMIRRIGLKVNMQREILKRCEELIISVLPDSRYVCYLPSVLAASIMLYVVNQLQPCRSMDHQNHLTNILKVNKEEVDNCTQFMLESFYSYQKRKYSFMPDSPNGVVDSCFSCESSNDSWELNVSSSPEPPFKKNKMHEDLLHPINEAFVDIIHGES